MPGPPDLLLSRCLGQPMALRPAAELAEAIAAAALAWPGGQHGALEPEVVWISTDGKVRLDPPRATPLSADYTPPPGGAADPWSIAAIFYEAATGRRLGRLPDREILHDGAVERALGPLGLPGPLHAALRDAMRFRPAARLGVRHLRAALDAVIPTLSGPPLASWAVATRLTQEPLAEDPPAEPAAEPLREPSPEPLSSMLSPERTAPPLSPRALAPPLPASDRAPPLPVLPASTPGKHEARKVESSARSLLRPGVVLVVGLALAALLGGAAAVAARWLLVR